MDEMDFSETLEDAIDEFLEHGGKGDEVISALETKLAAMKEERAARPEAETQAAE